MNETNNISKKLVETLIEKDIYITAMESCTGGYFLSCITDIDNSSKVTEGGVITYSNDSKIQNGVSKKVIEQFGVYSIETAVEMARACKKLIQNHVNVIGVGITGSLTIVDEKNSNSSVGKVYYSIDYSNEKNIVNQMTLDTNMDRHKMKEFVVKVITNDILKNIENV